MTTPCLSGASLSSFYLLRPRQSMVQISNAPCRLEDQPRHLCHFVEVDLVNSIGGPMIVHVNTVKVEDDRDAVLGIIPVVGAEIDALWVVGIVVVVVQLQFLELGVGLLADLMQLATDP